MRDFYFLEMLLKHLKLKKWYFGCIKTLLLMQQINFANSSNASVSNRSKLDDLIIRDKIWTYCKF